MKAYSIKTSSHPLSPLPEPHQDRPPLCRNNALRWVYRAIIRSLTVLLPALPRAVEPAL
jgi:hypothetical protein